MKKTKIAALAIGAALVTQAVQAANNDIVVGFTGGGPNDYVIDVGQLPAANSGGYVNLISYINASSFTTVFGEAGPVTFGAFGGTQAGATGNTGFMTGATAGTHNGAIPNVGADANGMINTYGLAGLSQGSLVTTADATSFTTYSADVTSATSYNPNSAITAGTFTFDLYQGTDVHVAGAHGGFNQTTWVDVGTFSLTESSGAITALSFQATPEPGSCALMAGAGLMVLAFRHKISRKNA